MNAALRPDSGSSPSITWSLYAGIYTFVCGTATAFALSDALVLLGDVIGLPAPYSLVVLASPTLVIGPVAWWTIVERGESYTYLLGGAFGLVTALVTGILWTAQFVRVWGVEMLALPMVAVLVATVLSVAVVAGVLTGLPLMYVRRRLNSDPLDGTR